MGRHGSCLTFDQNTACRACQVWRANELGHETTAVEDSKRFGGAGSCRMTRRTTLVRRPAKPGQGSAGPSISCPPADCRLQRLHPAFASIER